LTKNPLNSSQVSQVSIPDFNHLKTSKLNNSLEEGWGEFPINPVQFQK